MQILPAFLLITTAAGQASLSATKTTVDLNAPPSTADLASTISTLANDKVLAQDEEVRFNETHEWEQKNKQIKDLSDAINANVAENQAAIAIVTNRSEQNTNTIVKFINNAGGKLDQHEKDIKELNDKMNNAANSNNVSNLENRTNIITNTIVKIIKNQTSQMSEIKDNSDQIQQNMENIAANADLIRNETTELENITSNHTDEISNLWSLHSEDAQALANLSSSVSVLTTNINNIAFQTNVNIDYLNSTIIRLQGELSNLFNYSTQTLNNTIINIAASVRAYVDNAIHKSSTTINNRISNVTNMITRHANTAHEWNDHLHGRVDKVNSTTMNHLTVHQQDIKYLQDQIDQMNILLAHLVKNGKYYYNYTDWSFPSCDGNCGKNKTRTATCHDVTGALQATDTQCIASVGAPYLVESCADCVYYYKPGEWGTTTGAPAFSQSFQVNSRSLRYQVLSSKVQAPTCDCSNPVNGKGLMYRTISCINQENHQTVDSSHCADLTKPVETKPCDCPFWDVGSWSSCTPCNGKSTSIKTREVFCLMNINGELQQTGDNMCSGTKVATQETCSTCSYEYRIDTASYMPSSCDGKCGIDQKPQAWNCYLSGTNNLVTNTACSGMSKPQTTKSCPACQTSWKADPWPVASKGACGQTVKRGVYCKDQYGLLQPDSACSGSPPASTATATCSYSYVSTGYWKTCTCGETQYADMTCQYTMTGNLWGSNAGGSGTTVSSQCVSNGAAFNAQTRTCNENCPSMNWGFYGCAACSGVACPDIGTKYARYINYCQPATNPACKGNTAAALAQKQGSPCCT